MNASDWVYAAEGGKHAVFAYQPQGTAGCGWEGKVLRVDKKFFCRGFDEKKKTDESLSRVLSSVLAPYLDVPEAINLTWDFVFELRNQTLADGNVIPSSRLASWGQEKEISSDESDTARIYTQKHYLAATLQVNYRQLDPEQKCLAMEIKPKAGYMAASPLLHPLHRCKFLNTRFQILQQLHYKGQITKGWNKGVLQQQSNYCPLDLFSQDESRIRNALEKLFACPQNNLKVWYGDKLMFGHCEQQGSEALYEEALRCLLGINAVTNSKDTLMSALMDTVASILLSENLLPRLLKLQCLDIVDADGAGILYDRLVQMCGGSQHEAEKLIDSIPHLEKNCSDKASPFCKPTPCEELKKYCNQLKGFRELLALHAPRLPPSSLLDQARDEALDTIRNLTSEECVFLLRNWLLSLTMCDVSFVVTMRCSGRGVVHDVQTQQVQSSSWRAHVVHCQGMDSPGLVAINATSDTPNCSETAGVQYSTKLIDFDMKPASKLRNRAQREQAIRHYSTPSSV